MACVYPCCPSLSRTRKVPFFVPSKYFSAPIRDSLPTNLQIEVSTKQLQQHVDMVYVSEWVCA